MASPTILVVDDDQPLVLLLQENLELEGYQVIVGYDGASAMDITMARKPDLIILDVNIPYTNGIDVLTYLRKTPETASIPVIFMTGLQSKTLYPVIDRHQRVAYVKKPFDLVQLNSLIRQFLAQYPVHRIPGPAPLPPPAPTPKNPTTSLSDLPFIEKLR